MLSFENDDTLVVVNIILIVKGRNVTIIGRKLCNQLTESGGQAYFQAYFLWEPRPSEVLGFASMLWFATVTYMVSLVGIENKH